MFYMAHEVPDIRVVFHGIEARHEEKGERCSCANPKCTSARENFRKYGPGGLRRPGLNWLFRYKLLGSRAVLFHV